MFYYLASKIGQIQKIWSNVQGCSRMVPKRTTRVQVKQLRVRVGVYFKILLKQLLTKKRLIYTWNILQHSTPH